MSLTRGSEGLDLFGSVTAGKSDDVAHAEDRDQVIGDRCGDEAAKGFGQLAVVGLVPVGGLAGLRLSEKLDVFQVAFVLAFGEQMGHDVNAVSHGRKLSTYGNTDVMA